MKTQPGLDRALTFISCHLQPAGKRQVSPEEAVPRRAVTISRQAGSGAHAVAEKLATLLQARSPKDACPWTIFDRNLVGKVLQEHNLPERVAKFMPEDRTSEIADTMEELFGLHPPSWLLVRKVTETILHLAELGNVILIGRGAAVVTANLEHAFHVRLVSALEKRAQRIQELNHLSKEATLKFVHEEDRGRERYLKKYFKADVDDPLLYDLMINTDRISHDQAARIIADAVMNHP
ncbi:MAG: cytidylate kinase-like family protein [Verrucomicrobia bacterium]|nr:cytidylate kinase-like family protein [Verrucomicrobiota bacterium]